MDMREDGGRNTAEKSLKLLGLFFSPFFLPVSFCELHGGAFPSNPGVHVYCILFAHGTFDLFRASTSGVSRWLITGLYCNCAGRFTYGSNTRLIPAL